MLEEKVVKFVGHMMPMLSEKQRRIFLGLFSDFLGYGSVKNLHELTCVSMNTIIAGKKEAEEMTCDPTARPSRDDCFQIRKNGGGRKPIAEKYQNIEESLLFLLDGNTIGNPENPLCWTTKSLWNLQVELNKKGIDISHETVGELLEDLGFSLQQNKKYVEAGKQNPDRDEQFSFINSKVIEFQNKNQPVISVDTKKKELIGNFKNKGQEYAPLKSPIKVNDHDFPEESGKAAPYGIYDITRNEGFVNIGISSDTAEFAVNSIRCWWNEMGKELYQDATSIMITADGGGSNGSRNRLWKRCLQDFSNETGLTIHVSHFPPGTSKYNKIEHRLFSFISKNWRGRPLTTLAVIVSLISSTSTKKGLKVQCIVDKNEYEKGKKISDEEMQTVNLTREEWHGEWNYAISPTI